MTFNIIPQQQTEAANEAIQALEQWFFESVSETIPESLENLASIGQGSLDQEKKIVQTSRPRLQTDIAGP